MKILFAAAVIMLCLATARAQESAATSPVSLSRSGATPPILYDVPSVAQPAATPSTDARPAKEDNFFNWKNSLVFGVQAGGVIWYARERNGTLSNVTDFQYWNRTQYLKNTYLTAGFFALAADGAAYAVHKSGHGWKRHLAEHLLVEGAAAGLFIVANRNRHEYNTQECRFGEIEFCR